MVELDHFLESAVDPLPTHLDALLSQQVQHGPLAQVVGLHEPGGRPPSTVVRGELAQFLGRQAAVGSVNPRLTSKLGLARGPRPPDPQGWSGFRVPRHDLHQIELTFA